MITSEFPPRAAGTGYYVYNLSRKLAERGHHVAVVTRGSTRKTWVETIDRIKIFRVPFVPVYPFHVSIHGLFVRRLVALLEGDLDLVHLHIPFPPFVKTALPTVTTVHTPMRVDAAHFERTDPYAIAEKLQSIVAYATEKKVLSHSNIVTAVSQSVRFELQGYGLDPMKIIVIGNGVDTQIFSPAEKTNGDKYVLYAGRLGLRKGVFDLIRCAEKVCRSRPEMVFVIAGTGPLFGKLREEVSKLGLESRILFLGYVERERLIQLYQNALVYVLPSHYEGLPTTLLEAMACGIPVVATEVSGNTDVIDSGRNGYLVPPRDPDKMAAAILRLLDSQDLRNNIGRAARRTIERFYTLDNVCDNVLKCYRSAM